MRLINQIKNFFFWGWKLRNSVDFNANSLYEMIHLKLDTTYKSFVRNSHLMWNRSENTVGMRKLKIAAELAKRISEDKYLHNHYDFVENPEEFLGLEMHPKGLGRKVQNNRKREFSQKKRERELLFNLLEKHLDTWWD